MAKRPVSLCDQRDAWLSVHFDAIFVSNCAHTQESCRSSVAVTLVTLSGVGIAHKFGWVRVARFLKP